MYNKYLTNDADAFSELYRPVDTDKDEPKKEPEVPKNTVQRTSRFDLKKLLHGLDVEKMGIVPLVLLLLLLHDVEDEEKLIIIALAVIFGI